jgi:glyoxylase-like metal-dependent hydrolase (beta-lactamase superfamily II)
MQVSAEDPERPWAEAGVYELAPDLYRIPLPLPDRGLHAVNVYAVVTEQGLALIDSGQATEDARAWLERALAALDRKPADVGVVYTTHMHVDHYTQGIRMRREHPVEIRLGEIERPSIERTMNAPEELPPTQEAALRRAGAGELVEWYVGFWRLGAEMRHLFELPDAWMRDGEILTAGRRRLEAVHTPGHTRGHVSFLLDRAGGVLFAGDTAGGGKDGKVTSGPKRAADDPAEQDRSLTKLATHDFEHAVFGHGQAVSGRAVEQFREYASALPND